MSSSQEASPIKLVHNVKAPTLVCLGDSDLRVPPSQGRLWFRALQELGVPSRLHVYAGEAHPLSGVECAADVLVNSVLWLEQHLL